MASSVLNWYYGSRHFPIDDLVLWLSYGNDINDNEEDKKTDRACLAKREFCYIFKDIDGSMGYKRRISHPTIASFRDSLKQIGPSAVNIGAVYKSPLNKEGPEQAVAEWKELVFDIDISSYADVRICPCKVKEICPLCWPLAEAAIEVVNDILTDSMDYKAVFWQYSGRRGVHCWVSDQRARSLSNHERACLLQGMKLYPVDKRILNPNEFLHPLVERMLARLRPRFIERLKTQNLFQNKVVCAHLLSFVPDESIRQAILERQWATGNEAWAELQKKVKVTADCNTRKGMLLVRSLDAIVAEAMAPRFDSNVTTQMNHLIRCPFTPHQETGQLCVPFDPSKPFDPFRVPTVDQLEREVNQQCKTTSLDPHIEYFRQGFIEGMLVPNILTGRDQRKKPIIKFLGET